MVYNVHKIHIYKPYIYEHNYILTPTVYYTKNNDELRQTYVLRICINQIVNEYYIIYIYI